MFANNRPQAQFSSCPIKIVQNKLHTDVEIRDILKAKDSPGFCPKGLAVNL